MNFLGNVLGVLVLLYVFALVALPDSHKEQAQAARLSEKAGPPSDVSFTWWLPESVQPGVAATVTVQARQRGHAVAVSCALNGAQSVTQLNAAVLSWTPQAPGSAVMTCSAGGRIDMRLLAVGKI